VGLVTCTRCHHAILPGQVYITKPKPVFFGANRTGPLHVSCPTEREVQIARRWGRWL
jgi:hypothetical protein